MEPVPKIVIRQGWFALTLGVIFLAQGIVQMIGQDSRVDIAVSLLQIIIGVLWIVGWSINSVTVTANLVIVRSGVVQRLYRSEDVLTADLGHRRGESLVIAGDAMKIPFLTRGVLIKEAVRRVRGLDPIDIGREPALHGRARSLV